MKKTKVIINRKRWLRGEGSFNSALRNKDGKMCCVGFISMQRHNAKVKDILNHSALETCRTKNLWELEDIYAPLYEINDDLNISDKEREKELKEQCRIAKLDITLKFVN